MAYELTFNADTQLWTRTTAGIINYEVSLEHGPDGDDTTHTGEPGGPYEVVPTVVPFDPIHQTGGSFWVLKEGPNTGYLVSFHTNELGYGDITVVSDEAGDPAVGTPHINPLADWRVLIKGMNGGGGGTHSVVFNEDTQLWTRTSTGIINYEASLAGGPDGSNTTHTGVPGGPYKVIPTVVPFDPVHETGGSFYVLKEGPNVGYLVSFHTNSLGYGDITVGTQEGDRGPGATLATIYHAEHPYGNPHLAGFSQRYNAPGECHFTLLVDDPYIDVPKPKETHIAFEFFDTDAEEWVEVWAGLCWDIEATETEAIFYGIDYLGLFRFTTDERFNPSKPDLPPPNGSKYTNKTIQEIIENQLTYSVDGLNSLTGFIAIGDLDPMPYRVNIYSTFTNTLDFVVGLIDSHRAGTGKFSRIQVIRVGEGSYEVIVEDDPGMQRPGLALEYGVLAQGYKVTPFGADWADRINAIGRDRTGSKLLFVTQASAAMEDRWGRVAAEPLYQDSIDNNDLKRRALQLALDSSRIGRQIGVGTKLGSYRPFEGYVLTDSVPVVIEHGAVHTSEYVNDEFGAENEDDPDSATTGYWAIIGIQWESFDDGHWETTPILWPRGRGPVGEVISCATSIAATETQIATGTDGTIGNPSYGQIIPMEIEFTPTTTEPVVYIHWGLSVAGDSATDHAMTVPAGYTLIDELNSATGQNPEIPAGINTATPSVFSYRSEPAPDPETPELVESQYAKGYGATAWMSALVVLHTAATAPVQQTAVSPASSVGHIDVTLPNLPVAGNFLVAMVAAHRNDDITPAQTGWTQLFAQHMTQPGGGSDPPRNLEAHVYIRCYAPGEGQDGADDMFRFTVVSSSARLHCLMTEWRPLGAVPADPDDFTPPPEHQEGYGPPDENTTATKTYKDLASGKTYTWNNETEEWDLDPGSGDEESGVYDFDFPVADDEWVINHILTGYPRVTLRNTDGEVIQGFITYNSNSQITVTFSEPVAGSAHLG